MKKNAKDRWVSTTPTLKRIDKERFYALQYFFHEVFEISFLEKGMDKHHAKALVVEYLWLEYIARSLGYKVSLGTLFERHPLFLKGDGLCTRNNSDVPRLSEIGVKFFNIPAEGEDAQRFFKEVEKI